MIAAVTETTDPVGYITLDVAGTGGTTPYALSFKALGMAPPIEHEGAAENVGANTLRDDQAAWTDNQFNPAAATAETATHYLEITSGPGAGTTYDIVNTSAATKTVALGQNLATGVVSDGTFRIRKYWTIGTAFGAQNENGLQGGTATTADQILIYNGSGYDTYFYSTGGLPGTGWRKSGAGSADHANTKIYPDDGLVIRRLQPAVANVALFGDVKIGPNSSPIFPGLNIVGNVFAADMTLASSNLFTGSAATGVAEGTASTADLVLIYNGSTYDTYFYSSGGLPGRGWRKSGGAAADQAATRIPLGSAILVQRRAGAAFDWIAPQHPNPL